MDPRPTKTSPPHLYRRLWPFLAIVAVAIIGWFSFGDMLSFEHLTRHHERLSIFRDTYYVATVALFILTYTLIVGFSLPGATVATLTGGYLFGVFPGVLFNITGATLGATRSPSPAARRPGPRAA